MLYQTRIERFLDNTQSGLSPREVPFRSVGLGEAALRPYPTWIRTHLHLEKHRPPVGSHPNRFRKAAVARAATVVVGELVSLVVQPDAVPYGRCRYILLETRAKEHFSTGGSNAKMRFKKASH